MDSSSDDSDGYEPAPIGKPLPPPPVLPPRSMSVYSSRLAVDRSRETSLGRQSLFHTIRRSIGIDLDLNEPEGAVEVAKFITQYSTFLPCQVTQVPHHLPNLLPAAGPLNLHFIKHTKVVTIKNTTSGELISLPMNSAVNLSILYNPESNIEKAMMGYQYETVRDVMTSKPLPVLIKATTSSYGGNTESLVSSGEILCVLGVKSFLRSKHLRVQNIEGDIKSLSEKCGGKFTTAPQQLSLPVSSLIALGLSFPAPVIITSSIQTHTSLEVATYTMVGVTGETCLIASHPSDTTSKLQYLQIPSDTTAKVNIVPMDPVSKQQLFRSTQNLFSSFFSATQLPVGEDSGYRFHSQILPGLEKEGVQLVHPIRLDGLPSVLSLSPHHQPLPQSLPEPETSEQIETSYESDDDVYAVLSCAPRTTDPLETPGFFMQDNKAWTSQLSTECSKGSADQLSKILVEIGDLKNIVTDIQTTIKHLNSGHSVTEEKYCDNRRILANMDCHQVVGVLQRLDLPEYEGVFLHEKVDGHVLLQLTDDILSTELGIDSKLHRIRIMNLVNGKIPPHIKLTLQ